MSIPAQNDAPDSILEELHATRRRLLKEHGGVSGLAAFLSEEEAKTTWPIVTTAVGAGSEKTLKPNENRAAD